MCFPAFIFDECEIPHGCTWNMTSSIKSLLDPWPCGLRIAAVVVTDSVNKWKLKSLVDPIISFYPGILPLYPFFFPQPSQLPISTVLTLSPSSSLLYLSKHHQLCLRLIFTHFYALLSSLSSSNAVSYFSSAVSSVVSLLSVQIQFLSHLHSIEASFSPNSPYPTPPSISPFPCSTTATQRLISPPSVRMLDPPCLLASCPVIASVGGLTSSSLRYWWR